MHYPASYGHKMISVIIKYKHDQAEQDDNNVDCDNDKGQVRDYTYFILSLVNRRRRSGNHIHCITYIS